MDSIFWFVLLMVTGAGLLILLIGLIHVYSKLEEIEDILERIEFILIEKNIGKN